MPEKWAPFESKMTLRARVTEILRKEEEVTVAEVDLTAAELLSQCEDDVAAVRDKYRRGIVRMKEEYKEKIDAAEDKAENALKRKMEMRIDNDDLKAKVLKLEEKNDGLRKEIEEMKKTEDRLRKERNEALKRKASVETVEELEKVRVSRSWVLFPTATGCSVTPLKSSEASKIDFGSKKVDPKDEL